MSHLIRDYAGDIEIRSDGTGRTVHGILVPYNTRARVSDGGPAYEEMFAPGAFTRDIQARNGDFRGVKFLYQHDHTEPIGRAVDLSEDAKGFYGAFRIARTARGDEALELLREGVLDAFSIGFRAIDPAPGDPFDPRETVVRTKAALREASLVTFPAYAGALVAGVRQIDSSLDTDEGTAEATAEVPPVQSMTDPDPVRESDATPLGMTPAQRRGFILSNLHVRSSR